MDKRKLFVSRTMEQPNLHRSEHGLVAIFSVLIIMAILTLLTIGFSNVVRNAQNRTLNDQLNTQAFYAAETAINDARNVIEANLGNLTSVDKTSCGPNANFPNYILDASLGIEYTCLLIDTSPTEGGFDNVGDPVVTKVKTKDGSRITMFQFGWDSPNPSDPVNNLTFSQTCDYANMTLPTAAAWGNGVGMLRVDLVPTNAFDRTQMVNDSYTFFLYPTSNTCANTNNIIGVQPGPTNQAGTLITECNSTGGFRCQGRILLPATSTVSEFYMRMQSYYNEVATEFSVTTPLGVGELVDGWATVDATGKASGVYRRIRANIPVDASASYNAGLSNVFSLLSGESICKQLVGAPPSAIGGGSLDVGSCQTLN